jgi:superfamily II DNA or RNA helicase
MKTQTEMQLEAVEVKKQYNHMTAVVDTGGGKSKIAVDYIKSNPKVKYVVVVSPRTILKENMRKEFDKWIKTKGFSNAKNDNPFKWYFPTNSGGVGRNKLYVHFDTIQTIYKWDMEEFKNITGFPRIDLIIFDEIHAIVTPEYSNVFSNLEYMESLGLTATPDDNKTDKLALYNKYCPIKYRFKSSREHKIINGRRYIIFEHKLTDKFRVEAGSEKKRFMIGELKNYEYLAKKVEKAQEAMAKLGAEDYWNSAKEWYWDKKGNPEEQKAGRMFMNAIYYRKNFLLNLTSTRYLARNIVKAILEKSKENKVLVFSELTAQSRTISDYVIDSKQPEDVNDKNKLLFDEGNIRQLGSCNSLTLGVNLVGANYALLESYVGSSVAFEQKTGRTDRLPTDDIATVIIIKVTSTQNERWFTKAVKTLNINRDNSVVVNSMNELLKIL